MSNLILLAFFFLLSSCNHRSDFDDLFFITTKNTPQEFFDKLITEGYDTTNIIKLDTMFIGPAEIWAFPGKTVFNIHTQYEVLFGQNRQKIYSIIVWLESYDSNAYQQLFAAAKRQFEHYDDPAPKILTDSLNAMYAHDGSTMVHILLSRAKGRLRPVVTLNDWR